MKFTKITALLLAMVLALGSLTGCLKTVEDILDISIALLEDTEPDFVDSVVKEVPKNPATTEAQPETIEEDGSYYSKEDVALYLWTYHKLPANFITKTEAQKLGWEGGSVEKYRDGAAIGGDRFGNYEGLLPEDKKYRECDIDTAGEDSRGAKRIVYAEDFSAVYYTDDHYESFTQLYPTED